MPLGLDDARIPTYAVNSCEIDQILWHERSKIRSETRSNLGVIRTGWAYRAPGEIFSDGSPQDRDYKTQRLGQVSVLLGSVGLRGSEGDRSGSDSSESDSSAIDIRESDINEKGSSARRDHQQ